VYSTVFDNQINLGNAMPLNFCFCSFMFYLRLELDFMTLFFTFSLGSTFEGPQHLPIASPVHQVPPTYASLIAEITGGHHHAWLVIEIGSH
jgi:hypothetical protein